MQSFPHKRSCQTGYARLALHTVIGQIVISAAIELGIGLAYSPLISTKGIGHLCWKTWLTGCENTDSRLVMRGNKLVTRYVTFDIFGGRQWHAWCKPTGDSLCDIHVIPWEVSASCQHWCSFQGQLAWFTNFWNLKPCEFIKTLANILKV